MNIERCLQRGFTTDHIYEGVRKSFIDNRCVFNDNVLHCLERLAGLGHKESDWLISIRQKNPPEPSAEWFLQEEQSGRSFYFASHALSTIDNLLVYLEKSAILGYPSAMAEMAQHMYMLNCKENGDEWLKKALAVNCADAHHVAAYYVGLGQKKYHHLEAAKLGNVSSMDYYVSYAYCMLHDVQTSLYWALSCALFGQMPYLDDIICGADRSQSTTYFLGRCMYLGLRDTVYFRTLANGTLTSKKNMVLRLYYAEGCFMEWKEAAQTRVFTWSLIAKNRLGFPRDLVRLIAEKIWETRVDHYGSPEVSPTRKARGNY